MWEFPLIEYELDKLPMVDEPGSFGYKRSKDIHTGIDLYVPGNNLIKACESGWVIGIEDYTGPKAGSPWWLPTKSLLIRGESGVICYGECLPIGTEKGQMVLKGQVIAYVVPVLRPEKINHNIANHSRFMLHLELYTSDTRESVWWRHGESRPNNLLDPTEKLNEAFKYFRK